MNERTIRNLFVLLICCVPTFLSGCYKNDTILSIGTITQQPPVVSTVIVPQQQPAVALYPREWIPDTYDHRWSAIIIHHSATTKGNMAMIDEHHRRGNGWIGIGYDFVIGNGSYSVDGQVEVTFRWREQRTGAHTGTSDNWANEDGIGICLVGDFNQSYPSEAQMQSLARLVKFLQARYKIPASRIFGHGNTPGGHATDCPGRNFSMWRIKSML